MDEKRPLPGDTAGTPPLYALLVLSAVTVTPLLTLSLIMISHSS